MASKMYINYQLAPLEVLKTCPYDKCHLVREEKLRRHLEKCRSNYSESLRKLGKAYRYIVCPYNQNHNIPEKELQLHVSDCWSAKTGLGYTIKDSGEKKEDEMRLHNRNICRNAFPAVFEYLDQIPSPLTNLRKNVAKIKHGSKLTSIQEDNCWEGTMKYTYNPRMVRTQHNVNYYVPPGLTKSQRKQYLLSKDQSSVNVEVKGKKQESSESFSLDDYILIGEHLMCKAVKIDSAWKF